VVVVFYCLDLSGPALAVMVKYEVMQHLVGTSFDALPNWLVQWAKVDKGLISVQDVNHDGILQFAELKMSADVIMLATPELAGLPYAVSALVAAGGLAAALSTADGLLLTIGNAFAHDLYRYGQKGRLREIQRVMMSKFALLLVALGAAYVATQKPADILYMVGASFSLAASAFVPALVLGLCWSRTNRQAVVTGMLVGLGVSVYYMLSNSLYVHDRLGLTPAQTQWWGIQPIASGVFGFAAGFVTIVLGTLLRKQDQNLRDQPSEKPILPTSVGLANRF
jgi:cation/acetate symporter